MRRSWGGWTGPAADGAEGPGVRDVVVVAVLAAVVLGEALLRDDLAWPAPTALVTLAALAVLPWRRSRPLAVVFVFVATTTGFAVVQAAAGVGRDALVAMFALLAVPYALFRWGSGRARIVGGAVLGAGALISAAAGPNGVADVVTGFAFFGAACLAGALRRERVAAHARELDAARSREREALARDLHDTVAHHVSVIAIRAQAAAALPPDAERNAESFAVIELRARTVLAEMRSLVRALRAPSPYAPSAGVSDIRGLADPGPPAVHVRVDGPVDDIDGVLASTLHRIAQEGVTNARRHARGVSAIEVRVSVDAAAARVEVHDDGARPAAPADGPARVGGLGLIGVAERAALLGGEAAAGPDDAGGWTVRASLPLRERP
ncbi:sensor histidine kinase [Zhihengliuella halotolerans]|uniref:sensor histidine kinase n=1 Tax=Zhihengliuella halotolerans TaxID=370736 RepID=UPI001A930A89|nr:histidine kinase [Zhihengliuella halotolerans]